MKVSSFAVSTGDLSLVSPGRKEDECFVLTTACDKPRDECVCP